MSGERAIAVALGFAESAGYAEFMTARGWLAVAMPDLWERRGQYVEGVRTGARVPNSDFYTALYAEAMERYASGNYYAGVRP